jgi:hypothetical protein
MKLGADILDSAILTVEENIPKRPQTGLDYTYCGGQYATEASNWT